MKVREVMNTKVVFVKDNTPFIEVWNLLFKKHTHAVPVIDKNKQLVGIIATEDLLKKLYPSYADTFQEFLIESRFEDLEDKIDELKNLKSIDVMSKEIHYCYLDDPILKALSKMVVRRIRQLPVVDNNQKLLGVVSKRDIFDKFFLSKILGKKS